MHEKCKQCKAAPAGSMRCHVAFRGENTKVKCPLNAEDKKEVEKKLFPNRNGMHPAIAKPPVITATEFRKRNGGTLAGKEVAKFLAKHPHSQD